MTGAGAARSLNDRIGDHPDVLTMLRNAPVGFYRFPVPDEHTNWRSEQAAWQESAVLFDQSWHMTDLYISGPDKVRLVADHAINDLTAFDAMKAAQAVVCSEGGHVIGDAILFHLANGELNLVGKPPCANFIEYAAVRGGYDVTLRKDVRTPEGDGRRETFRFQLQGPNAFGLLETLNGGPLPETRHFGMCGFGIAGIPVTGLRHGMASAPGMEFWGPSQDREAVLAALLEAGREFGLKRGGARTYSTAGPQSGWVGAVLPAIYDGDAMSDYRDWLPETSYEATLSLGGSLDSDDIADFHLDPWDLGYDRLIHWDHGFQGRDALLERRGRPHRRKIWLRWNPEDVLRVQGSMLRRGPACKYLEMPAAHYATCPYDKVLLDGREIGLSVYAAYTMAVGGWFSIGILNEADIAFGQDVELVWGEPDGGTSLKPTVEPHEQTAIRATMARTALG